MNTLYVKFMGATYGNANRPSRADDAKTTWEEVTNTVNQVCPDILRTAAQCKKWFNDVRRRAKKSCQSKEGTRWPPGAAPPPASR